MLYKRKQTVLIDIFFEPCFIMYHIGNGDVKLCGCEPYHLSPGLTYQQMQSVRVKINMFRYFCASAICVSISS